MSEHRDHRAEGLQFLCYRDTFMIPWVSHATPQELPLPGIGRLPCGKSLLTPFSPRWQGHPSNLSKGCDSDFWVAGSYVSQHPPAMGGNRRSFWLRLHRSTSMSPHMSPRCLQLSDGAEVGLEGPVLGNSHVPCSLPERRAWPKA